MGKSQEYWNNRSVELNESLLAVGDEFYKRLSLEYEKTVNRIEKEIEAFYSRFSVENKISYSQAKKILTSSERKRYMLDLDDYIKKGNTLSYSNKWAKELENASTAHRVTRLQALQLQMKQQIEELYFKYDKGLTETVETIFHDGYYKSVYDFQKEYGLNPSFSTLDTEKIKNAIAKPWAPDGSNFSDKIWKDKEKLTNYLNQEMTQAFIRGESPTRLIKEIKRLFGVSSSNAARLVQTESAYFSALSKLESYKASGFKKYIIVAVMDVKTSRICKEMDGEVFDIEDFMPGATANPFHPRCRTTTAPYVGSKEGQKSPGMLYDHDKKRMYSIPEDMTFKEWYAEYVLNKENIDKPRKNDTIDLTDNEQRAVNRYIGGESYVLNEKLRNDEALTKHEQDWYDNLNSALDKMPDYEGFISRSLYLEDTQIESYIKENPIGSIKKYHGFTSFTKGDIYNPEAQVQIFVESKKGKNISMFNAEEDEILYKAGTEFKIMSFEYLDGYMYIYLEEI